MTSAILRKLGKTGFSETGTSTFFFYMDKLNISVAFELAEVLILHPLFLNFSIAVFFPTS